MGAAPIMFRNHSLLSPVLPAITSVYTARNHRPYLWVYTALDMICTTRDYGWDHSVVFARMRLCALPKMVPLAHARRCTPPQKKIISIGSAVYPGFTLLPNSPNLMLHNAFEWAGHALKTFPFRVDMYPSANTSFFISLDQFGSTPQTGLHHDDSAVFARLTSATDTQRPWPRRHDMRRNNQHLALMLAMRAKMDKYTIDSTLNNLHALECSFGP